MARSRRCSTRLKTAFTHRRLSWPGAWLVIERRLTGEQGPTPHQATERDVASIDASRAGAQVLPFYLAGDTGEAALVRGRFATIGAPVTQILSRHGYPDAVAALQAEAMAITACLSTFMKFDGVFTLQAKGDGYVKTLLPM